MALTWKNILAIVFFVVALFLLAAMPAAEASESPAFTTVDDSTELIATETDVADVYVPAPAPERPSASPGGVVAKVTNSKVTDNATEVPSGGAVGLASTGIRGPTTA